MSELSLSGNKRNLAVFAFAATALTISACSGSGASGSANQAVPGIVRADATPPFTWNFRPIDDSTNGNNSRVTGIEDEDVKIVGLNGTTKSDYSSWISNSPFKTFTLRNYSSGVTYMSSVEGNYQAGTVYNPTTGLGCTTCGFIYHDGAAQPWTLLKDPEETCPVTEVLGLGDEQIIVGYYEVSTTSGCENRPFEAYNADSTGESTGETYVDFSVPGEWVSAETTGVNESDDAIGTMTTASGATTGWFYSDAYYCIDLQYPYATNTYPMGINWQDQVVGYFTDSGGNTHGFVLNNPVQSSSSSQWQQVDYTTTAVASPNAIVSNISDHDWISGWYKDLSGHDNGFIGECSNCGDTSVSSAARARHRIREMLAHGETSARCSATSYKRGKHL
jgi:hypothetical protein